MTAEQMDLLQEILNIENIYGAFRIVFGDDSCITGGRVYKYEDYQNDAIKIAHQIIRDEIEIIVKRKFDAGFDAGSEWERKTA